jgi:hypothetical protein
MAGNPISGHTNKNLAVTLPATNEDGLGDGDHILSPTLTNMVEGVHGNGIIMNHDTSVGEGNRNIPAELPGAVDYATVAGNTFTVKGGYVVLDGIAYAFAGGEGGVHTYVLNTSSASRTGSLTPLASGEEALVVVYACADDDASVKHIYWEKGTANPIDTNNYPACPSAFLNEPSSLANKQTLVLAVLRVVYASGGGDLKLAITEVNDKRVFIRPTPIYFSPVTTGDIAATAAVDTHTELDNFHSGEVGAFTASRFGGMWQSFGAQIASTVAGDNAKDVLYYSGTHAARFTRSVFDRVLTSTATSIDLTSADANILVLTPGGSFAVTTSGSFPAGYVIEIKNTHGSNTGTFALTNSTTSAIGDTADSDGGYAKFVCITSHASDPTFVRLV